MVEAYHPCLQSLDLVLQLGVSCQLSSLREVLEHPDAVELQVLDLLLHSLGLDGLSAHFKKIDLCQKEVSEDGEVQ